MQPTSLSWLSTERVSQDAVTRTIVGALSGIGAIAVVSGVVKVFESWGVPALSLGPLYVFAVLPTAIFFGVWLAVPVGVVSMLVFNYFFLPPTGTLHLRDDSNWVVLVLYLVVAVVTSELAARAGRRAAEAGRREQEAALLSSVATTLLAGESTAAALESTADQLASVLGATQATITLGPEPLAVDDHQSTRPLVAGRDRVGTLVLDSPIRSPENVVDRVLPAVASLLRVAVERRRLQDEVLEAEKLRTSDAIKTTILRSVSHDLRSPLTAIRVAADGLANPNVAANADDHAALAATILEESGRLDRLVGNLLDLSRLEAGAMQPERELWPVDELIWRALGLTDSAMQVETDIPAELPAAFVDAGQVVGALANVLQNAVSHAESRVTIVAESGEGVVVIRVFDDGPGVPASDTERIFQPFQSGSYATAGSGLGLTIARGFVEANGGTVDYEPGEVGATFAVRLPARAVEGAYL